MDSSHTLQPLPIDRKGCLCQGILPCKGEPLISWSWLKLWEHSDSLCKRHFVVRKTEIAIGHWLISEIVQSVKIQDRDYGGQLNRCSHSPDIRCNSTPGFKHNFEHRTLWLAWVQYCGTTRSFLQSHSNNTNIFDTGATSLLALSM